MPILIACAAGLGVLAALVLSGAMALTDLAHPFWQIKASLTGGLVGAALSAGLIWITDLRRKPARRIAAVFGILLAVVAVATWRAARIFIDSADYEPTAGQIWFYGYHALAALLVAGIAMVIISMRHR